MAPGTTAHIDRSCLGGGGDGRAGAEAALERGRGAGGLAGAAGEGLVTSLHTTRPGRSQLRLTAQPEPVPGPGVRHLRCPGGPGHDGAVKYFSRGMMLYPIFRTP